MNDNLVTVGVDVELNSKSAETAAKQLGTTVESSLKDANSQIDSTNEKMQQLAESTEQAKLSYAEVVQEIKDIQKTLRTPVIDDVPLSDATVAEMQRRLAELKQIKKEFEKQALKDSQDFKEPTFTDTSGYTGTSTGEIDPASIPKSDANLIDPKSIIQIETFMQMYEEFGKEAAKAFADAFASTVGDKSAEAAQEFAQNYLANLSGSVVAEPAQIPSIVPEDEEDEEEQLVEPVQSAFSRIIDILKEAQQITIQHNREIAEQQRQLAEEAKANQDKAAEAGVESSKKVSDGFKLGFKTLLKYGLGIRSTFMLIRKLRSMATAAFKDLASQVPEVGAQFNQFNMALAQMKGSVGSAIQPIFSALLPAFLKIAEVVSSAITSVAKFFALLAGQNYIYKATAAQKDYAKAVGGSANAQQRTVAGFDELNKLQDSSGGGSGSGVDYQKEQMNIEELADKFQPLIDAWNRVKKAAQPILEKLNELGKWLLDNVIEPVGEWLLTTGLPGVLDIIAALLKVIDQALEFLKPILQWLWETILQPLGVWLGNVLGQALQKVAKLISEHSETLGAVIGTVITLASVLKILVGVFSSMPAILKLIGVAFKAAFTSPLFWITALIVLFTALWDNCEGFREGLLYAFDALKSVFTNISEMFDALIQGDFASADEAAARLLESICGVGRGILNAFANAANFVIGLINSISIDIPEWLGGGTFAPNIQPINVPKLATGAVIPPNKEFLAILGDQSRGNNIETPEGLLRDIIREEMSTSANDELISKLDQLINAVYNIRVGDEVIGRASARFARAQARAGGR